jgi:hypothetical protein
VRLSIEDLEPFIALADYLKIRGLSKRHAGRGDGRDVQGSILRNSISGEKNFGQCFILKFWTNFHPKQHF